MPSLKTGGFAQLIVDVVARARSTSDAAVAVRTALTLDGRLTEELGLRALTAADRAVVGSIHTWSPRLDTAAVTGDRLFLTRTGRLTVRLDGVRPPENAALVGAVRGDEERLTDLRTRWRIGHDEAEKRIGALRDEFVVVPAALIHERIDRIGYAVRHMAPVQVYVNDRVYTNLGRLSNLPGKSLSADSGRSLLTTLRRTPVARWSAEDVCFVACFAALLASGPPVRAEEFNGAQLNPATLTDFLVERIAGYGGVAPTGRSPLSLADLEELAAVCVRLRRTAVAGDTVPYRLINGLNLYKQERLMPTPALLRDAPAQLSTHVAELLEADPRGDTRIADLAPLYAKVAARLVRAPAPDGFATAFEAVLHEFVRTSAEAFESDVAMSRGPQRFDPLRVEPGTDPFGLGTGDFYCCVAPRRVFDDRFGADREGLVRALSSYSARMRFNTWHYLPHTLGIVEREPGRDDWFFAPTMADVTEGSDQHHTGHVAFGVHTAIRVPFGIDFDGRSLPGLYDLRLMRTTGPRYTVDDLRRAVATAMLLRQLYQAMSVYEPVVTDFGKPWYGRFHGGVTDG